MRQSSNGVASHPGADDESFFRVVALASGSSGNAYLVETPTTALIVEAGISARRIVDDLTALRVPRTKVAAVVVTHEHGDHASSAAALARLLGVPIATTCATWSRLDAGRSERIECRADCSWTIGDVEITPFAVPHDAAGAVGFVLERGGRRVALATDLGHVPPSVQDYLDGVDLVILDCNHDSQRLSNGSYPRHLKARIASDTGHLSNAQAAEAILHSLAHRPRSFWLAHLSKESNSASLARRAVVERLGDASSEVTVEVTGRDRRSLAWFGGQLRQGVLF